MLALSVKCVKLLLNNSKIRCHTHIWLIRKYYLEDFQNGKRYFF